MSLLSEHFQKYMKRLEMENSRTRYRGRRSYKRNKDRKFLMLEKEIHDNEKEEIQCEACKDFGLVERDCANTLQKQKEHMLTSWSDDKSVDKKDEGDKRNFVALAVVANVVTTGETTPNESLLPYETHTSDSDEEISEEDLERSFKDLYTKKICS